MPEIIRTTSNYHESPDWGLLGTLASCTTAVGPGAALALASPAGAVASYLPSPADLSASVLARCPLTVVDLGQIAASERGRVSAVDAQLARIAAELPPSTLLLVTAPGAAAGTEPGPGAGRPAASHVGAGERAGFADGLLDSSATRRPGVVTLTDLTPTVAAWLGQPGPGGNRRGADHPRRPRRPRFDDRGPDGARHRRAGVDRHARLVLHRLRDRGRAGVRPPCPALLGSRGGTPPPSRPVLAHGRGGGGRGSARHVPREPGSVVVLDSPRLVAVRDDRRLDARGSGSRAGRAVAARRARPVRRDRHGHAPVARRRRDGRVSLAARRAVRPVAAGQRPLLRHRQRRARCLLRRRPGRAPRGSRASWARAAAVLVVGAVGLLAVVASGWPGFGAKVGGTIALVPCLLLLAAWLAGVRVGARWAVPVRSAGLSCSSRSPWRAISSRGPACPT